MLISNRARPNHAGIAALVCAGVLSLVSFGVHEIETGDWVWAWPDHALADIRPELGLAYIASTKRMDLSSHEQPSRAVIVEDGRALGPANAQHADIRTLGRGRFSFWHDYVYLSASDSSDPRTNGRRYAFRTPPIATQTARVVYGITLVVDLAAVVILLALGAGPLTTLAKSGAAWLIASLARVNADLGPLRMVPVGVRNAMASSSRLAGGVVAGGLLLLLLYFSFALYFDLRAGLLQARNFSTSFAMNATWAAAGAVLVVWLLPENRRDWRVGVLVFVLIGTGMLLYLRAEPLRADLLPGMVKMGGPMMAGVAATALLRRARPAIPHLGPSPDDRLLWIAVATPLVLSAPMIVLPVVENWNASGWMDSHSYDAHAHNILSGKVPEGNSQYMPVYQYGLAAVYYLFGHFFFAQQLVNVALAFVTIVLLCFSAWNLFRNVWAVLLIGIWVAFLRQFVYAVFFTQIESWYIPMIAFTIFAWTCYWRTPSRQHLVLLAIAAAIAMNTRNQGAFYFAWLCLAPLFIAVLPWRRRFADVALAILILAASLVPWSVRNYVVDGRFSPSAGRNAYYFAVLNDPRIGFYGVRYWEGWSAISDEYDRKYTDPAERDRVMMREGLSAPLRNPGWFARAMYWRTVAFYGLLPEGILAGDGPRPTNWAAQWPSYVYLKIAPLIFVPLALAGLALRPGRATAFLAVAVLANVALTAITGGAEDRVSYPVLPLHMLMGLAAIFAPQTHESRWSAVQSTFAIARPRTWAVAAIIVVAFLVAARVQFGRDNLYAPQSEPNVVIAPQIEIDELLPSLNEDAAKSATPAPLGAEWEGRTVRLRFIALNYQCPPKFGGRIAYMPDFATDPARETYYYAALLMPPGHDREYVPMAVTWFGAKVSEPLREGDEVEAEGRVLHVPGNTVATFWIRIDKARKVVPRSSEVPAFF